MTQKLTSMQLLAQGEQCQFCSDSNWTANNWMTGRWQNSLSSKIISKIVFFFLTKIVKIKQCPQSLQLTQW